MHLCLERFSALGGSDFTATYSNYTLADDPRAVTSFAGGLAARLGEVKHRYDPANLFRRNHNIAPYRQARAQGDSQG